MKYLFWMFVILTIPVWVSLLVFRFCWAFSAVIAEETAKEYTHILDD